ncbi:MULTISPECIES: hypothetical protein [Bradyrhizobium]|uniref:hypothetical protein n=1 Tax=Bradyrhizobium TaxID=374 RepID=UPI0012F50E58|nr:MULTISPECIES: hypothetical protein [Bradyrhizobium]MBR1367516.1 hypothetical protein [Bradyrhizobium ottawaense]
MTLAVSERLDEINLDQFSTTEHALYRALRRREWDSLPLCPQMREFRRKTRIPEKPAGVLRPPLCTTCSADSAGNLGRFRGVL